MYFQITTTILSTILLGAAVIWMKMYFQIHAFGHNAKHFSNETQINFKITRDLWTAFYSSIITISTTIVLFKYNLLHATLFPFKEYSVQSFDMPAPVHVLILAQIGYYVLHTFHLFFDQSHKHRAEMILHHFVTIPSLCIQYTSHYWLLGIQIQFIHLGTAVFLNCGKLFGYIKWKKLSACILAMTLQLWIYFRVFALISIIYKWSCIEMDPYWTVIAQITLLSAATLANTYWFILVLKILYQRYRTKLGRNII
eukprot:212719_1